MGIEPDIDTGATARAMFADEPAPAQYMATAQWLARHFSRPFVKAPIEQVLPQDYETRGKEILPRVLAAIGLKSQFTKREISRLDPVVLPCVLFTKTGKPLVLVSISDDRNHFDIVYPEGNGDLHEIGLDELQKTVGSELLVITKNSDATENRTDPFVQKSVDSREHWLWNPIRNHKGAWFQIMLAALGTNVLGLALPIFVMNVYDRVIPNLAMITLWTLAGGVAIALLLDLLLKLVRTNVLEMAGRRIDLKVASTLFQQAMNIKLLERQGGAAAISSQIRDFEAVRDFFTSSSFVAVIDVLFIGIFVFVLWIIVGPIAIVPLLAVPVVVILAIIAQIPIGRAVEETQRLSAKRHLVLVESLLGIETVKSLNGERVMQQEWENAVAASSQVSGKTRFWSNFAISATMLTQQAVSIVIIVWGVYLVAEGAITVGGLIAANILAGRVLAPLGNISQTIVRAQQALKSLSLISQFMQLPTDTSLVVERELSVKRGKIDIQGLNFTYPGSKVAALSEFSLSIEPGTIVGILGRVGSGKTTLGKMFIGLIEPQSGVILVDNHEIQQYEPAALREGIGYLPQDPELFTGTIRENLILGKPDATEDEIAQALYFAGMDYFIAENPEGLNQFVGEKGNRLSGGQRQAISLARLLLRKPKIIFLDEPTNAMDHTTESIVTARLKELKKANVTLVISTHRHSLAAIAERLIVLDNGKKVLDGPREEVLKKLSVSSVQKSDVRR